MFIVFLKIDLIRLDFIECENNEPVNMVGYL